jgi:hypothetical protein
MSRPRISVLTAVILGGSVVLAGCSHQHGGYHRGPIPGNGIVYSESDDRLHIEACGAEFRMTETAREVTIISADYNFPPGVASCRVHDFTLTLHTPLGARPVIDGTTHKAVPVTKTSHFRSALPQMPAPSLPS